MRSLAREQNPQVCYPIRSIGGERRLTLEVDHHLGAYSLRRPGVVCLPRSGLRSATTNFQAGVSYFLSVFNNIPGRAGGLLRVE